VGGGSGPILQRIQRDIGERWIEETEHLYRSGGIAAHSESEGGGGFGDTGDVGAAPCGTAAGVFPAPPPLIDRRYPVINEPAPV
jgi:hypothetical protein